jgi:hypothetical protein
LDNGSSDEVALLHGREYPRGAQRAGDAGAVAAARSSHFQADRAQRRGARTPETIIGIIRCAHPRRAPLFVFATHSEPLCKERCDIITEECVTVATERDDYEVVSRWRVA